MTELFRKLKDLSKKRDAILNLNFMNLVTVFYSLILVLV